MTNVRIYQTDKGLFVTDERNIVLAEKGRPHSFSKRALYEVGEGTYETRTFVAATDYTERVLDIGTRVNSRWAPGIGHCEMSFPSQLENQPLVTEIKIVDEAVYRRALELYQLEERKHSERSIEITTKYQAKIDELKTQIADLETKKDQELETVSDLRSIDDFLN